MAGDFVECGLCGTAAVISPVGRIESEKYGNVVFVDGAESSGPVMRKLRATLTGIQTGDVEDIHGWGTKIC